MSWGPLRKLLNCVSMMDTLFARATGITLAIPACCRLAALPAPHQQHTLTLPLPKKFTPILPLQES